MVNCPKCDVTMTQHTIGFDTFDRCDACGGFWFDGREHEVLAQTRIYVDKFDSSDPRVGAKMNKMRDIDCPVCHTRMMKLSVPEQLHIQYESCPVCHGSFFDAGELKDFASFSIGEQIKAFFDGFRR